jgi:hypothetical protein
LGKLTIPAILNVNAWLGIVLSVIFGTIQFSGHEKKGGRKKGGPEYSKKP